MHLKILLWQEKPMVKKKQQSGLKLEGGATISSNGKSVSITNDDGGRALLTVTNEYGNSAVYPIEEHSFDGLWSQLWQFVKDNQH
jgi:hypothetical protein